MRTRQHNTWTRLLHHIGIAVLVACATAAAAAVPSAAAQSADPSAQPFAAPIARTVTLITGDKVTVSTSSNGTPNYTVEALSGDQGFQSYQAGDGDQYVIPAAAVPYLGQLDLSLFDVTALAKANAGESAEQPVQLQFRAGAAPHAPSGVTLTSVAGSWATGYYTSASAPAFGAALRRQIEADLTSGRRAGSTPLPASITDAGAQQPADGAHPHYPLHILHINTLGLNDQPANALVTLVNVDTATKENAALNAVDGVARIAVPAGNYAAYATYFDYDAKGNYAGARVAAADDFVVSDSPSTASVTIDENAATAPITVTSPKPATHDLTIAEFARFDATGQGVSRLNMLSVGDYPVYVSPVAKPSVGTLRYLVQWGGSTPNPEEHYRVDLAFVSDRIPSNESFVNPANRLAAVHDVLYSDPAATTAQAGLSNGAVDPVLAKYGNTGEGFAVPGAATTTDYLGTMDGGTWEQSAVLPTKVLLDADPRTYHDGQTASVDWGRGPVVAGLGQRNSPAPALCEACFSAGTVTLGIPIDHDSVPGHSGSPLGPAEVHYTLYRNDVAVFDQDHYYGATVEVPATPATLRGVLDVDMTGLPGVSQAVRTHTEETVHYDPAATNAPLPGIDSCDQDAASTPCQILGAITVGYQLHADLTNTSHSPIQVLGLTVGHVAYNGVGSRSPISEVTVSVSFDNGATWQRVPVVGSQGNYTALWPNPASAAGTTPSLLVTARDDAGDALRQTISNAYTIAKTSN